MKISAYKDTSMARKKFVKTYNYSCELTGQSFVTTKQATSADDLISVKAWYEMNPEKDDRPEVVKQRLEREVLDLPPAELDMDETEEEKSE